MPSLSDFSWYEDGKGVKTKPLPWKTIPAINTMAVGKKYKVEMEDKRLYEGTFRGYTYTKQRPDACQVQVFLELDTESGRASLSDLNVVSARSA